MTEPFKISYAPTNIKNSLVLNINDEDIIIIQGEEYTSKELKQMFEILRELNKQKHPEDYI